MLKTLFIEPTTAHFQFDQAAARQYLGSSFKQLTLALFPMWGGLALAWVQRQVALPASEAVWAAAVQLLAFVWAALLVARQLKQLLARQRYSCLQLQHGHGGAAAHTIWRAGRVVLVVFGLILTLLVLGALIALTLVVNNSR